MSKGKKYNFNMVEIALAMVVIALGISGILGLFSVGVNARKSAITENNVAEAAEYILGTYRGLILNKIYSSTAAGNVLAGLGIPTTKPGADAKYQSWDISGGTDSDKRFSVTGRHGTSPSTQNTYIFTKSDDTSVIPTVFCYAPFREVDGENIADCQLVGRVWRAEDIPFPYRSWASGAAEDVTPNETPGLTANDFAIRVFLELSWPVEKAYDDREKRIFVMDVVNPLKEL